MTKLEQIEDEDNQNFDYEHVNTECLKLIRGGAEVTKEQRETFRKKLTLILSLHPEILKNEELKSNIVLLYPDVVIQNKEHISKKEEKQRDLIFRRLYLEGTIKSENKGLNPSEIINKQISLRKKKLDLTHVDNDSFLNMLIDGVISLDTATTKKACNKEKEKEVLKELSNLLKELRKTYRKIVLMVEDDIDNYDNFLSKDEIKPFLQDFKAKTSELCTDLRMLKNDNLVSAEYFEINYSKIRELFSKIKFNKSVFDELSNSLYKDIDRTIEKIKNLT